MMIFFYFILFILPILMLKELIYFVNPYRAVLISTQTKYINPILTQILNDFIKNTNNKTFVEIGAGYSKVTLFMAKNYKWQKILAIEISLFLVYVMRLVNIFKKLPIQYVQANIFNYELPENAVIYSYMSRQIINKIYKQQQLKNCLFISLTFKLQDVTPTRVYDIKKGYQKKIYVYDFRPNKNN
jgi:hypothetical protein